MRLSFTLRHQNVSPQLPTAQLVRPWSDHLEESVRPTVADSVSMEPKGGGTWQVDLADGGSHRLEVADTPRFQSLAAIVHSLTALLLALLGGLAGRWFYVVANHHDRGLASGNRERQ